MNQRELADLCGTAESTMSTYLSGRRTPKAPVIAKMADALGVTTDYLLAMDYEEMVEIGVEQG